MKFGWRVFSILLALGGLWYAATQAYFLKYPRLIRPELGLVVPHSDKGVIVYISKSQDLHYKLFIYVYVAALAFLLLCIIFAKIFPNFPLWKKR